MSVEKKKPWCEPEGYTEGLHPHVEGLSRLITVACESDRVLAITYCKRTDHEANNIRSVTGEVLAVLARHGCTECPMWPAAYVPCGPNGRALYYMCKAEMEVLRRLMRDFIPKVKQLHRRQQQQCSIL